MNKRNREFYESDAGRAYNMFKFDGNPLGVADFIRAMDELDLERDGEEMQ